MKDDKVVVRTHGGPQLGVGPGMDGLILVVYYLKYSDLEVCKKNVFVLFLVLLLHISF